VSIETQRQRTELSWRRTVLSGLAVGVLFARFALLNAPWAFAILGPVLSVFLVALAWRRIHGLDRPIRRTLPVVAVLIPVYAVTSAALILHIA
jgi:uncharacterized membrane protein YidH (DUF202 family)